MGCLTCAGGHGHVELTLQMHHVDKSFWVPLDRICSLVAVYRALTKERIAGVIQCERMKVQRVLACPVQRIYLSDRHCVHGLSGTASWVLMQAWACR